MGGGGRLMLGLIRGAGAFGRLRWLRRWWRGLGWTGDGRCLWLVGYPFFFFFFPALTHSFSRFSLYLSLSLFLLLWYCAVAVAT